MTDVQGDVASPLAQDGQEPLVMAQRMSLFLGWVERVRLFTSQIETVAAMDKEFGSRLRAHGVRPGAVAWEDTESQALEGLYDLQAELIRRGRVQPGVMA